MSDDESGIRETIETMEVSAITVGVISALSGCTVLLTLACFPSMMWREKRIRHRDPESRESSSAISAVPATTTATTATTTATATTAATTATTATATTAATTATTATATTTATTLLLPTTAEPGVQSGEAIDIHAHMVCMLALSDVLGASAYALGFPTSRSVCIAQGVLMLFFQRAKWIWNTLIVYQLYRFMVRDVRVLSILEMHASCWSVCILFEILPLFDGVSYGLNPDFMGAGTCFYDHEYEAVTIRWFDWMYFSPLASCILIMSYSAYHLWMRYRYLDRLKRQDDTTIQVRKLTKTMVLYPVTMLITTLPNMIIYLFYNMIEWTSSEQAYIVAECAATWSHTQAIWLCAIFFYNSQEARRRWRSLVFGIKYDEDGNRLVRREQEQEMKQVTLTSVEKSMNAALSDTAGKSAGQSKIPLENGKVEIKFTSGSPGSGPSSFLSQIESAAENPMFDSPPASFDAKNIDDDV